MPIRVNWRAAQKLCSAREVETASLSWCRGLVQL